MKEKIIKIGVLIVVFFAAIFFFNFVTNRGNDDMTADMGNATLPTMSFSTEGYEVNSLVGYRNEMNIPAMRDTITPVHAGGNVEVNLNLYGQEIKSFFYELYTLDGKEKLFEKTEKLNNSSDDKNDKNDDDNNNNNNNDNSDDRNNGAINSDDKNDKNKNDNNKIILKLGNVLEDNEEAVLKVTLTTKKGQEIYYYTRVVKPESHHVKECLDFAKTLHTEMLEKRESGIVSTVIEPNEESDNTTLQHVTIHSDLPHILWGKLKPEIVGDVFWDIKETNETYTAVQLRYQVKCEGETNEEEVYYVKEFFRVRYLKGKLYLLNYDRTMNQMLDTSNQILTNAGIDLGIVPKDMQYEINADGTIVGFIQERELWSYDKEADALSLVFSFRDSERKDIRNLYDQHAIRIISMEKNGNMSFGVYGYMNRGEHEGKVGAAIYYFDLAKNVVEEKAFIPSDKSFTIAQDELGKLVYYNNEQNVLYVLVDGTLYKVNLEDGAKETVAKNLGDKQYVVSEDGHLLSYQNSGTLTEAVKVTVLNFQTGKSYEINAAEGENIRPLGFIKEDFIYGISKAEHAGKTVSGESIVPMYKLEINNSKKKVVKTYQLENIYIADVFVENNMITLNRLMPNGSVYTAIDRDYITNNEEKKESNISFQSYPTDLKETQYRIAYEDRIEDLKPKILKPKQVLFENPTTIAFESKEEQGRYYVYGLGVMVGMYDKAGYAVQKADKVSGVVVSSNQAYVWERGNRDLIYKNREIEPFAVAAGETTLAACVRQVLAYEGKQVDVVAQMQEGKSPLAILKEYSGGEALDLTGCTAEEMLYIIGKGTPVIAMTDSVNAILLTGYDAKTITYLDPADSGMKIVPIETIDAMTVGSGHTFIGYVK